MECVWLVDWGWVFDKLQSVDLNEYISIQNVVMVVIFYDLLNLLLSDGSCKEWEFGTER